MVSPRLAYSKISPGQEAFGVESRRLVLWLLGMLIKSIGGVSVGRFVMTVICCTMVSVIPLALVLLLHIHESHSADAHAPHKHQGLLAPYDFKPPAIRLDSQALDRLNKGQPVRFQVNDGNAGGRGIVIQDVHAPVDVVLGRILDFGSYSQMVTGVSECGNYEVKQLGRDLVEQKTKFVLSMLGVKLEYYIRHLYRPSVATITWTLDYSRTSDLDDSVGYWSVKPLERDNGEWSRVFYSIDMRVPEWIPGIVLNILKTQALTQATAWVKTHSEKVFKAKLQERPRGVKGPPSAPVHRKQESQALLSTDSGMTMWEAFLWEYRDLVDTEKAGIAQGAVRPAGGSRAAPSRGGGSSRIKGQDAAAEGTGRPSEQIKMGDGRMVLSTVVVSALFFALARILSLGSEEGRFTGDARESKE